MHLFLKIKNPDINYNSLLYLLDSIEYLEFDICNYITSNV